MDRSALARLWKDEFGREELQTFVLDLKASVGRAAKRTTDEPHARRYPWAELMKRVLDRPTNCTRHR